MVASISIQSWKRFLFSVKAWFSSALDIEEVLSRTGGGSIACPGC